MIFYEKETEKNEVVARPVGRSSRTGYDGAVVVVVVTSVSLEEHFLT